MSSTKFLVEIRDNDGLYANLGVLSTLNFNRVIEFICRKTNSECDEIEFDKSRQWNSFKIYKLKISYRYVGEGYRLPEVKSLIYRKFIAADDSIAGTSDDIG